MTPNLLITILVVLAIGYVLYQRRGALSSADAHRLVEAGARLVDVRTPQEFATGHLPGAVNIPVQELERRSREIKGKDRPVIVYCRSGARSSSAARMLKQAGYAEVHNLGAMSRW